jgi:transposase
VSLRVFNYLRGRKVCPMCDSPLTDLRRDARGHDACMREFRRRVRARASTRRVRRQTPGSGHVCPSCGGEVLLIRVLAVGELLDPESVRLEGVRSVSGGKRATCASCEWQGTVARTREKVAA